ncbi:hypothetical protein ABZP36_034885 [Zizania latifolia]
MLGSCGGGYRTQTISGRKEKFVRLEEEAATMDAGVGGVQHVMDSYFSGGPKIRTRSVRIAAAGVISYRAERLKSIGRVFQEDLKNMSQKIFDPQDAFLVRMNRLFVMACILSVAIDPLFFYLPAVTATDSNTCIGFDRCLATGATAVRSAVDAFYLARIALQFRTAYIAPSSRVFGRGELVIDKAAIARRYLHRFFLVDLLSVLPLPQIPIWNFLHRPKGADLLPTKNALLFIVLVQYIPRLVRFYPITSELKRTTGVFAETAFAGAAYYLLLYMLASHVRITFNLLPPQIRLDNAQHDR